MLTCCALAILPVAPVHIGAENDPGAIPITGTVLERVFRPAPPYDLRPVAGAEVLLMRDAFRLDESHSREILAKGKTDANGRFDLGSVHLRAEIRFPLETAAELKYAVVTGGRSRVVDWISFTAPRQNLAVTSVSATIYVK